jgi:hypothetical protein
VFGCVVVALSSVVRDVIGVIGGVRSAGVYGSRLRDI